MNDLLEELREVIVEYGFTHRWAEVEMWHSVGRLIGQSDTRLSELEEIADHLGTEEDDLWNAIIFYKKYPDLNTYPSGKNISWNKIKNDL